MTIPRALRSEFRDTVTIEPYAGQNSYGEATFGTAGNYPARVEMKSRRIAGTGGVEITARGRVLVATSTVPSTRDRLTLPSWAAPTQPTILDVQAQLGDGFDHVVVYFGA